MYFHIFPMLCQDISYLLAKVPKLRNLMLSPLLWEP